ncbi:MAG: hypothetical protein H7Y61_06095, partial [Rhizobiales bacterium]|nr:hypothetical protein [Rhizobacter sp.]
MTLCSLLAAVLTACGGGSADNGAAGDAALAAAAEAEQITDADALRIKNGKTKKLATEGASFSISGTQTVRFGADSRWIQKLVNGTGQCTNGFFGSDPAVGTVKSCELITVASTLPAAPTPVLAPAPA